MIEKHEQKISMIAAISKNRALGKDGKLPWSIPEDMKYFKDMTTGHVVIMGRKTFDSVGKRPLSNRTNIVVTRDPSFTSEGVYVTHSLDEAITLAKQYANDQEIFIIGGGQLYTEALPLSDKLYLTVIDIDVPGADTFFPDYSNFGIVTSEEPNEYNGIHFTFCTIEKNHSTT